MYTGKDDCMKTFINFSNHPYAQWMQTQKEAAEEYGEVVDLPFPPVPPEATCGDISEMADEYVSRIMGMNPGAVMCQGEFTLAFAVVAKLKSLGVEVLAACSERKVTETVESGITKKLIVYEFVQFRDYI